MLPLYDETPHRRTPVVTLLIIAACVAVTVYEYTLPDAALGRFIGTWGLTPARMRPGAESEAWWTLLTSMFLHGGLAHVAGNCWFLWLFGNNVEDRLGPIRYIAFFLVTGIAAATAQFVFAPGSTTPMVGASGAISGILGAYFRYLPRSIIITLTPLWFAPLLPIPAFAFILLWFAFQIWNGIASVLPNLSGGVAWWAHIGGFLAGAFLARPFAPRPRARRKGD